jgi:hypothetical protein
METLQGINCFLSYHFGRWAFTSDVQKEIEAADEIFQKFCDVRMCAFAPTHGYSVRQTELDIS